MSVEVKSVSHEYVEHRLKIIGYEQKYALGFVIQLLLSMLTGGFKRRRIKVLDGVDLFIDRGEFLGLIGVNGSGKTTLLKIIGGLLTPTSGDVIVNGFSMVSEEDVARRYVMYIPGALVGGAIISPFFTVRLALKKIFELYGIPVSRVDEALKVAKLESFSDRRILSLSSGLAARLMLASALFSDAEVFLFDEPVVGISAEAVQSFYDFIRDKLWRERDSTIIYATNNLNEVQRLCRRIAILHGGKIVTSGSLYDLVRGIGLKEVVEIRFYGISSLDEVKLLLDDLAEKYEVDNLGGDYYQLKIIASRAEDVLPLLIERLVRMGGRILSVKVRDISLEEVFIHYVGKGGVG